jgi:hypothetical protein
MPRGETVSLAEGELWGPIRARLAPNRLPHQVQFRFESKAPSVRVEGIEEYRLQYMVTDNVEIGRGASLWRSPPQVAIAPESTTRFSVRKGWGEMPSPPERTSTDPVVTVNGVSFSDGSIEGSDPEVVSAQVQYETRKLQGRMIVAELRRMLGRGGVVTESKISLADSRTPQVTEAAVDARLAHPEFAKVRMIAWAAPDGRQDVMNMLKVCASQGRNPDDGRRCVADLEQMYQRY